MPETKTLPCDVIDLTESDDLYGAMVCAVRAWLAKHHASAEYANVVAHIRDGLPDVQVPVTLEVSALGPPPS